jgi:hypothetical protein
MCGTWLQSKHHVKAENKCPQKSAWHLPTQKHKKVPGTRMWQQRRKLLTNTGPIWPENEEIFEGAEARAITDDPLKHFRKIID